MLALLTKLNKYTQNSIYRCMRRPGRIHSHICLQFASLYLDVISQKHVPVLKYCLTSHEAWVLIVNHTIQICWVPNLSLIFLIYLLLFLQIPSNSHILNKGTSLSSNDGSNEPHGVMNNCPWMNGRKTVSPTKTNEEIRILSNNPWKLIDVCSAFTQLMLR